VGSDRAAPARDDVDGGNKSMTSQLYLLYPSSGQVPRKVAAFRDFVVEWFASTPLI
jgi:DNA-binding transcriptional LysR family regulator